MVFGLQECKQELLMRDARRGEVRCFHGCHSQTSQHPYRGINILFMRDSNLLADTKYC